MAKVVKTRRENDNVSLRRSRRQQYNPVSLQKDGSYAEPGTRVSIRNRKQK